MDIPDRASFLRLSVEEMTRLIPVMEELLTSRSPRPPEATNISAEPNYHEYLLMIKLGRVHLGWPTMETDSKIDQEIQSLKENIRLRGSGDPEWITINQRLYRLLLNRYPEPNTEEMVGERNGIMRRVLESISTNDPRRARYLAQLSRGMYSQYLLTNSSAYLLIALARLNEAIDLTE